MTDSELKVIAVAAMMGLSRIPKVVNQRCSQ